MAGGEGELGGVLDGSTRRHERRERLNLTLCCLRRGHAVEIRVPHASRRAAATHSSRPSIGIDTIGLPVTTIRS